MIMKIYQHLCSTAKAVFGKSFNFIVFFFLNAYFKKEKLKLLT